MSAMEDRAVPYSHRLVDYLIVAGLTDSIEPMDPAIILTDATDLTTVPLKPNVLDRYPPLDWKDYPITPAVSLFCFPQGVSISATQSLPSHFTFVVTEALGAKIYGSCLVFHELMQEKQFVTVDYLGDGVEGSEDDPTSPGRPRKFSSTSSSPPPTRTLSPQMYARRQSVVTLEAAERPLYEPKCLCILSHHPFYQGFKQFLCELYRLSCSEQTVPIERIICNLFEAPLPPLGRIKIQLSLPNKLLSFSRPPPNALPMADFPLDMLFYCLDVDNILALLTLVLLERKIIFLSNSTGLLTIAIESIISLIFPFRWQGGYVPVLPVPLLDFINAPVPYLMGVKSGHINQAMLDPEIICVDLDKNAINGGDSLPELPRKEWAKLRKSIETYANVFNPNHPSLTTINDAFSHPPGPDTIDEFQVDDLDLGDNWFGDAPPPAFENHQGYDDFVEGGVVHRRQLRASFLRFFVALLHKYRKYIDFAQLKQHGQIQSDVAFDKKGFVEEFNKSDRPFMLELAGTQLWSVFMQDRIEYHRALANKHAAHANQMTECRFFDECVDAKENRSKLNVYKKGTPFLAMDRYSITDTYAVPPPDVRDIPEDAKFKYDRFPELKAELFKHRKIAEVLEEQDVRGGYTSRMNMSVTMAALLKGREYSLFQNNANKDTAVIQLLQSELDNHRVELNSVLQQLELKDLELRAKDLKIQKCELETAALRVELAQLKMKSMALTPPKAQHTKSRPSVADAFLSFGLSRDTGHHSPLRPSLSSASPARSSPARPVPSSLQDPPTLLLVNFITTELSVFEETVERRLATYQSRMLEVNRQLRLLRVRYESGVGARAPKRDTEGSTLTVRSAPKRRFTFSMSNAQPDAIVRFVEGQPLHHASDRILRRTRAVGKQLLAQFPESSTQSMPVWVHLHNEVKAHVNVLNAQLGAAIIEVLESPRQNSSSVSSAPPTLSSTPPADPPPVHHANTSPALAVEGAASRNNAAAGNANGPAPAAVEEAKAAVLRAMKDPNPPRHVTDFAKCIEIMQDLESLRKILEPLTASQPKEPVWVNVLLIREKLRASCEDARDSAEAKENGKALEKVLDERQSPHGRSKVLDVLVEEDEDGK